MARGKDVIVTPGEDLGDSSQLTAGHGVHTSVTGGRVQASLTGFRKILPTSPGAADQRPTIEVVGYKAHWAVPEPGSVVIARVTKVMDKMVSTDIMCVGSMFVKEKFTGIIRLQDVRATKIDEVDMYMSFCPGDIVRALVLSLGDARACYLSTAENEFGVVFAPSIAGSAAGCRKFALSFQDGSPT